MVEWLEDDGVGFFAGVPDSLLADFCACVSDRAPKGRHVITANEGGAVALAMGHFLATGEMGMVYLQNSGLGNCINPLTSLADAAVYGVPLLLIIGWRSEPGRSDEPQHVTMGRVTPDVLRAVGVPFRILPDDPAEARACVAAIVAEARAASAPHALVVRHGTFAPYAAKKTPSAYALSRERAIELVVELLPAEAVVVSTTGKPSRELFELRKKRGEPHRDFLTVGGMGHASQIALGIALGRPECAVFCIDGDGAVLMHMGGLATIGALAPANYKHLVLNNGVHDSVGGQPTVAFAVDLAGVARACCYREVWRAESESDLVALAPRLIASSGPALLEVRVAAGARADLGRPSMTPAELKQALMRHIAGS
jgi:phosphonopyruvate decarboxylase